MARETPLSEPFSNPDADGRIEAIRRRLSALSAPLILFIDNIDYCREAGVDRLLNALVFNTPGSVKLLVSSSSTPVPFNAGRAHLEMNLQTIKAADLSFDRKATSELFEHAGVATIDSAALDEIVEKTEGWPAAIRLLQLTVDPKLSLRDGVELLAENDEHISDLLSHRLMSSFEPDLVDFLYEIAELRQFSVELAQFATGNPRAAYWVQFLVDRNIMTIPVDRKHRWFRFHTLFRQFLINEARRKYPPSRRSEVLLAASRWLMRRGDLKGAFELALNAGERALVSEILEKASCVLVREQGDTSTFIEWIRRSDEIGAERGVQATFWYAWALMFERRFSSAKDEIRSAYQGLAHSGCESAARMMRAKLGVAEIVVGVHLDTPDAVSSVAEVWLRENPGEEPFEVAAAAGALACSRFAGHDFVATRDALRISQAAIAQSNSIYGRCWVEVVEAVRETYQGDPVVAARRLDDMERQARVEASPGASIISVVAVVRARALQECGQIEEAERIVADNLLRAAENGVPDSTWAGLQVALPAAVRGDGPFSVEELRSIAKKYPRRIGVLFELALLGELVLAERTEEALERASEMGWTAKAGWGAHSFADASEMEKSAARVTSGILLMSCGHLARAAELFQEEIRAAQATGRRRELVDLNLLVADVHFRSDARIPALRAFTRAVTLTARREIFLPFLKRRKFVAHLREHVRPKELGLSSLDELTALNAVFRLVGICPSPAPDEEQEIMAVPTPRETELLYLLEAGLDNSQIAERLSVSVRTIKWHLSNLYSKLDVKNRSAAVAKGRALRLLQ